MKDKCSKCEGLKDTRAIYCMKCRFIFNHPRKNKEPRRVFLKKLGYYYVMVNNKFMFEHRHVMEQHLGRKLQRNEHVHHKNGDKTDNRIENLEVVIASEHARNHIKDRAKEMSVLGHKVRWGYDATCI